jgi:hypothetical protein
MKNIDIYEVSRDEYVGFLGQIKLNARRAETVEEDNNTILRVYSANTGVHLCSRVIPKEEGEEKYYVFNMPADDERKPPEAIRKIILSTKEEVQTFFDILSKIQKGEMKND